MNLQQETDSLKISPNTFRNFVRRLNNAAIMRKQRHEQLSDIGERMKALSVAQYIGSEQRPGVSQLKSEINLVANEERMLSAKQRISEKETNSIARKIDVLEHRLNEVMEKIEGISNVNSVVAGHHLKEIAGIRSALAAAKAESGRKATKHEESGKKNGRTETKHEGAARKEKDNAIYVQAREEKIEGKPAMSAKAVEEIGRRIEEAERMHKRLEKAGHPKEHLDRMRQIIDKHKKRLGELKG